MKWHFLNIEDDECKRTILCDPDGNPVMTAQINRFEEDANHFHIDEARLLEALNQDLRDYRRD
jgi:hypothetical protein